MPRRTRGGSFRQTLRRKTFWIASSDSTGVQTLAAASAVLDQVQDWSDLLGPSTIVRTRGSLWVASDIVNATEQPFGALGMAVVRTAASDAGVASVPTPITDEEDDSWFVWKPWLASSTVSGTPATFVANRFERYDFDSKAMRKISDGDTIAVVLENAEAGDGAIYVIKFRMLIKTG